MNAEHDAGVKRTAENQLFLLEVKVAVNYDDYIY